MSPAVSTLFVTWQEPESRRIFPVARVVHLPDGTYELGYIRAVLEAEQKGFAGLPGCEDTRRVYVSAGLPGIFEYRLPARGRRTDPGDTSEQRRAWLDAAPITLFVPSGEGKNERLEVFAPPIPTGKGEYWGVFAVRGVGRVPETGELIEQLEPHEKVLLILEPENLYNPRALRVARADQTPIGYVPDYLANELAAAGSRRFVEAEILRASRVNFPPAPAVYTVSCRYTCPADLGRILFRSDSYEPMSKSAYRR